MVLFDRVNDGKKGCARFQITCQEQRSKHFNLNSIYRIFYKNAKKAKAKNEICPSDIQKHNVFEIMPGRDKLQ